MYLLPYINGNSRSLVILIKFTFATKGRHSSLLPEATALEMSQRAYTVSCGQRPQHLKCHREAIYSNRPPQLNNGICLHDAVNCFKPGITRV